MMPNHRAVWCRRLRHSGSVVAALEAGGNARDMLKGMHQLDLPWVDQIDKLEVCCCCWKRKKQEEEQKQSRYHVAKEVRSNDEHVRKERIGSTCRQCSNLESHLKMS